MLKLGHGGVEFCGRAGGEGFADVGEERSGAQSLADGELVQRQVSVSTDSDHDGAKDRLKGFHGYAVCFLRIRVTKEEKPDF